MSKDNKTFDIEDHFIDFGFKIIQVTDFLPKTKVGILFGNGLSIQVNSQMSELTS